MEAVFENVEEESSDSAKGDQKIKSGATDTTSSKSKEEVVVTEIPESNKKRQAPSVSSTEDATTFEEEQQNKPALLKMQQHLKKNNRTNQQQSNLNLKNQYWGKKTKKMRVDEKLKDEGQDIEVYEEFKTIFDQDIEVINYDKYCEFLTEVKGRQDVLPVVKKYTADIQSLVDVLALNTVAGRCISLDDKSG
ncbi:hypothetical protein QE152_g15533 [Popillia japonica]|uniref:Uncharacterized protein n=1 Tax=Popillia japonica TaxID=7064 RepID=A0AAW1L8T2_POPJA